MSSCTRRRDWQNSASAIVSPNIGAREYEFRLSRPGPGLVSEIQYAAQPVIDSLHQACLRRPYAITEVALVQGDQCGHVDD